MFVDAVHRKYIEECGAANFFGIKDNTYITPKSTSILPSITNKSLRQLAKDMGMKVEERPVAVDELSTFEECAACGTAAVISPIGYIYDKETGREWKFGDEPGKRCLEMYNKLQDIQYGRCDDPYGWTLVVGVVYSIRSVFREVVYEFLLTFGNTNFGTENMRSPCVTACFFGGNTVISYACMN